MEVDDDETQTKHKTQELVLITQDNREELNKESNFGRKLEVNRMLGEVCPINSEAKETQEVTSQLHTDILEQCSVEIPTSKHPKKNILNPKKCKSVTELRLQYPELDVNRDLLVGKLVELMESMKPPPPPQYFYIKRDQMFLCLFCVTHSKSLRAATHHFQHTHGLPFMACFACSANYHEAPVLYNHEKECLSSDAGIVLEARAIFHKRRGTYTKQHKHPTEDGDASNRSISPNEKGFDSDANIMAQIPNVECRKRRTKMFKWRERLNYIEELRCQYPELKADRNLLIETLVGIMRIVKPPPPPQDYFIMSGIMFKCTICEYESRIKSLTTVHYQDKHGPRFAVCFACGFNYTRSPALYDHEKHCRAPDAKVVLKARAKFEMLVNNEKIIRRKLTRKLSRNKQRVKKRHYQCELCPASFGSYDSYRSHQHLHSGSRPNLCEHCPAAYTSKNALLNHIKMKHTNVEFICDHCKRSFKVKRFLIAHMKTHYPESQFCCEICDRRFAQKRNLVIHVNNIHLKLAPTFECPMCKKRYTQSAGLRIHVQKVHGSTLITRKKFQLKLPTLSEAELKEVKKIYDPDLTKVSDTLFIPQDASEKESVSAKKKPAKRKRKKRTDLEFICDHCKHLFKQKHHLVSHMNIHYRAKNVEFICDHCKLSFKVKHTLAVHMRNHYPKPQILRGCKFCDLRFKYKANLIHHVNTIHLKSATSFECPKCKKSYWRNSRFKRHMQKCNGPRVLAKRRNPTAKHMKVGYICDLCKHPFKEKFTLEKHMKTHNRSEYKICCEFCDRRFMTKGSLIIHVNTIHLKLQPTFECPICKKRYWRNKSLKAHMRKIHGSTLVPRSLKKEKEESISQDPGGIINKLKGSRKRGKRYQCEQCPASFFGNGELQSHLHLHSGTRPYRCEHCPAAFTSKRCLYNHTAKHLNVEFICDHCKRSFPRKQSLKYHMKTHYPESKIRCEFCDRRFCRKELMTRHMNSVHLKLPPTNKCPMCEKRFWQNTSLKQHVQKEHGSTLITRRSFLRKLPTLTEAELMKVKNVYDPDLTKVSDKLFVIQDASEKENESAKRIRYQCEQCPASFYADDQLQSHLHLHSGTRPYRCEHCPAAFTSKRNLYYHKAKHLNVEFICDHCKRSFSRKEYLKTHMKTHYPESKIRCEFCDRRFCHKVQLARHVNSEHLELPPTIKCPMCEKRFWQNASLKNHVQKKHGSTLITRKKFLRKLPTLSEAEFMKVKNVYDPDLTKVSDTLFVIQDASEKESESAKKKPAGRKRKLKKNKENPTAKHMDVGYICDLCKHPFKEKFNLEKHMKTHNRSEYKICCEFCDRRFMTKGSLIIHVNTIHLKLQPTFECPICKKRYWRNEYLKAHMRKIHGSTLVPRSKFLRKLPTLSEAEFMEVKNVYDSDLTKVSDTLYIPQDASEKESKSAKKKPAGRKRKLKKNKEVSTSQEGTTNKLSKTSKYKRKKRN